MSLSSHKAALREAGLPMHGTRGECLQRIASANMAKSKGVNKKPLRRHVRSSR